MSSSSESEILHFLVLKTLNESNLFVDYTRPFIDSLCSVVNMPLFTELAVEFDLALSESVVVETEMDLSLFHCVVPDSEGESEMDPPLSDERCSEMDLDFHLSDSMVAETNLEGASVAKGGAVWSSTAEAAAQRAVEVEMEPEAKHRRISCPSDVMLMLLLPAYFALVYLQ
ncbi:hypothetical protein OROHE_017865 [Orobanche hederae]